MTMLRSVSTFSHSCCLQCLRHQLLAIRHKTFTLSAASFSQRAAQQHVAKHKMSPKPALSTRTPQKNDRDPSRTVVRMLFQSLMKRHELLQVAAGSAAKHPRTEPSVSHTDLHTVPTSSLILTIQQTPTGAMKADTLAQIQRLLIKRAYTTPLEVSLKACHSLLMREHSLSQYLSVLFSVVDEIFDRLSPSSSEVTQLFLYIFIHGSAPQMLFYRAEEYLLENLDQFHINDLGVICGGFFRANTRIVSQDLLDAIAQKLLKEIDSLEPFLLPNFLKMFRHSSYIRVSFYEKLADHLVQTKFLSKYKSVNPLMHIAFMYASLSVQHEPLFNQLLRMFEELFSGQRKVRTKDISKFIWACGTLQFKPENYRKRYQKLVDAFRADQKGSMHPESLGELLIGLTYLEIFPEDLLNTCLSTDVTTQLIESGSDREKSMQLILLQETVSIECPDYTGSRLSQTQVNTLLHHPLLSQDLEKHLKVRTGLAAILFSLRERLDADRVHCHYPLPHFNSAVIELHYSNEEGFLPFTPEPARRLQDESYAHRAITDDLLSALTQKPPAHTTIQAPVFRLAIAVAGNHQLALNSRQPLGHWSTKLRQLHKLGYTVCQVSSEVAAGLEWSSHEDRCQQLSELMSSCLQTQIDL